MDEFRVRPQTLLWIGFAVLSMALSHEFAHWSSCEMLGYTSYLRLNAAGPLIDYSLAWHAAAVDVASPLLTVLSACTFYYFIVVRGVRQLLPFLLVWLAMRLLASIFGVLTMLNDEARLSLWLGMAPHVLPAIVCAFLLVLAYREAKKLQISVAQCVLYLALIYVCEFALIAIDQMFRFRLI
jgi:hypothetical protein